MKAWHWILVLCCLQLSGCLVTFREPLPASQAAPAGLLGHWVSKDDWGEHLKLRISQAGARQYRAVSYAKGQQQAHDQTAFTVSRHGSRWYASAAVPKAYGGGYAIVGFELIDQNALVVYNLDVERVEQALQDKSLVGKIYRGSGIEGVMITSSLDQVFAYLDDPANSDVFVEVARYQRVK